MNDTEKPFACSIKDCDMTFTNEDHLNWHQKKHDMMLNLGLADKQSEVADQTPTPTRFIRNCEEVGLFQDLQNVNPFDEFFKKAVETSKSGAQLEVPSQPHSEDTLHTPHILPHIEESQKTIAPQHVEDASDDFLHQVIPLTHAEPESPVIVISDEEESNKKISEMTRVKLKMKEILQKKKPLFSTTHFQALIPNSPVKVNKENKCYNKKPTNGNKSKKVNTSLSIDQIRETNRAAQMRCRRRKRENYVKMQEELKRLRIENDMLRNENEFLRGQLRFKVENDSGNVIIDNATVSTNSTLPNSSNSIKDKRPIILQVLKVPIVIAPKTNKVKPILKSKVL